MKKLLLKRVEKSPLVKIYPDFVDGVPVTRLGVKGCDWQKLDFLTWASLELLDRFSGFYGFRITLLSCSCNK